MAAKCQVTRSLTVTIVIIIVISYDYAVTEQIYRLLLGSKLGNSSVYFYLLAS